MRKKWIIAALWCLALLSLSQDIYALKPVKEYAVIPDTLHMPFEKNKITVSDNVTLQLWTFLPSNENDNHVTLVLAYADAGNMSWWVMQASMFSQLGYTVLLFDYRGFGESSPFTINPKMLYYNEFTSYLNAAVAFAKTKYPKNKTGIWCFSMGTIIATLAAKDAKPDFIIGDGFVTDPEKIESYYAKKKDEILLPPAAYQYSDAVYFLKVPLLIFSGTEDEIATDVSVRAFKKKKVTKTAVTIVNFKGGHLHGFEVLSKDFPGSEYAKAVDQFLKVK